MTSAAIKTRRPQPNHFLSFTLSILALAALIALTYRQALDNGFHFDDEPNIVRAISIHLETLSIASLVDAVRGAQRPNRIIPNLSFAIDWWRSEGDPRVFQLGNILSLW